MENFQTKVLNEFRCYLTTPEVAKLSNKLLIVATAIDNSDIDNDTKCVLSIELDSIYKGFIESEYQKRFEVLSFISQMREKLL